MEMLSNKKASKALGYYSSFILFLVVVILVSGNTNTHDYIPYSNNYYGYIHSEFEAGYTYFSHIFSSIGVSFDVFKLILFGIGMLLIRNTAHQILSKSSLWFFYILYAIYPLTLDSSAIRNTIAMCFLIFSLQFLPKNGISNVFKYIILILIASLFHTTFIFYLLLLLIRLYANVKINNSIFKIFFIALLANAGLMILSKSYLVLFLDIFGKFLISNDLIGIEKTVYFNVLGNWGFLLFFMYQLITIVVLKYFNKVYNEKKLMKATHRYLKKNISENLNIYIYYVNIFMIVLVPLYRVNSNFFRLYRNIIPMNYIIIIALFISSQKKNKTIFVFLSYIITTIFLAVIEISPMKELAFYTLFTDNWIFNLFK